MTQLITNKFTAVLPTIPLSIRDVITFNGITFNDRRFPDAYILTGIDGLADADIRDSRDINPDFDGETPYTAYHGGRTIVIEGYIRAGNIEKLNDMRQKLKAAFNDLTEHPLTFQRYSYLEDWSIASALAAYWVNESGNGANWVQYPNGYTPTATGVNLCPNGSFEHDTNGATPAGWDNLGDGVSATTFTGSSGSKCLLIGAGLTQTRNTTWLNAQAVSANVSYRANCAFQQTSASGGDLRLQILWYSDAGGTALISTSNGSFGASGATNSTGTISVTATAPSNAVSARVAVDKGFSTTTYKVDGLLFAPASQSSTYNDGDSPSWTWTGTVGNSTSQTPASLTPISRGVVGFTVSGTFQAGLTRAPQANLTDARVTLEVDTSATTGIPYGITARKLDSQNYLLGQYTYGASSVTLTLYRVDAGVQTQLTTSTVSTRPLTGGSVFWVRFTFIGNSLTLELSDGDPATLQPGSTSFLGTLAYTLSTAQELKYGTGVYGGAGWRVSAQTDAYIEDFKVESINPSDVQIGVRKSAGIQAKEEQTSFGYIRRFQLQVRASNPVFVGTTALSSSVLVSSNGGLARVYDRTYDLAYTTTVDSGGNVLTLTSVNATTITNIGDYRAYPLIRLYGYLFNPTITNVTTGDSVTINGAINDGDYWDLDFANHTVTDSLGNSRYAAIDPSSTVLKLASGANSLSFNCSDSGGTQTNAHTAIIYYRNTWL